MGAPTASHDVVGSGLCCTPSFSIKRVVLISHLPPSRLSFVPSSMTSFAWTISESPPPIAPISSSIQTVADEGLPCPVKGCTRKPQPCFGTGYRSSLLEPLPFSEGK